MADVVEFVNARDYCEYCVNASAYVVEYTRVRSGLDPISARAIVCWRCAEFICRELHPLTDPSIEHFARTLLLRARLPHDPLIH